MAGIRLKTAFASQPLWQQILIVLVFNTLIALLIHIFIKDSRFIDEFVISQCIGLSILFSYLVFASFVEITGWKLIIPLLVGTPLGVVVVMIVQTIIYRPSFTDFLKALKQNYHVLLTNMLFPGLFFGIIIVVFFAYRENILRTRSQLQAEEIVNLEHQKKHTETHLRLLQAQIEPHFLFNTLSNVISLIDSDPQKSKTLLESLTAFLRATLKRSSNTQQSLADEIKLIEDYLAIMKIRLGDRLDYTIHCPHQLAQITLPPLLLQPLVENAVIHGIEPLAQGGHITIGVTPEHDMLRIQVSDSGRGLQSDVIKGFGLNNVRDRLKSLYGDAGRLHIKDNPPHGVKATLEVPRAKA